MDGDKDLFLLNKIVYRFEIIVVYDVYDDI